MMKTKYYGKTLHYYLMYGEVEICGLTEDKCLEAYEAFIKLYVQIEGR